MSDMVERVAKAMASKEGDVLLGEFAGSATNRLWMGRANAAIEAMREPTAAMLESVYENCHSVKSAYEDSNVDFLADGWRAMIDTALTDVADR